MTCSRDLAISPLTDLVVAPPACRRAVPVGAGLTALLGTWYRRARTRRALAALDERLVRDVGLPPDTARAEARKPFWC